MTTSAPPSRPRKKRSVAPKHETIVRAFKFAMDVPEAKSGQMFEACATLCEVRNEIAAMLAKQRQVSRDHKAAGEPPVPWLTKGDLFKFVSSARKDNQKLDLLHSHLAQNVCVRVLESTERWMEALAEGRKDVRPPRMRDPKKYRSFTFQQYGNGCRIENHRVFLSGFGWFRLHDHRKIRGRPQTITIKFTEGRWWCILTVSIAERDWFGQKPVDDRRPDTGADPGLSSLLTNSHGDVYDPPRALKEQLANLRKVQRAMARKFRAKEAAHEAAKEVAKAAGVKAVPLREVPHSNRLKKQIRKVAKIHTKVDRVRDYHHKKIASVERSRSRRIAVEEHGLQFMIRNRRLARSASDRAIGGLKQCLGSAFGSDYFPTPNQRPGIGGNSQTCLCGASVPKELSERVHHCGVCGLEAPRDVVSANIVQAIAFGTVSEELVAHYPAGGQPVVTRGETEAASGESRAARKRKRPLEVPLKRAVSLATPATKNGNTAGAKATAAGKTPRNRKRQTKRPTLPGEPKPHASTTGEAHPL